MSVRLRRLQAEYERLKIVFAEHERIRVTETLGRPPDKYVVEYRIKGLVEEGGVVGEKDLHRAEISLGPGYPREMPRCVMLTPVFHPNIDHLAICTEDIGSAGQTLDQTIIFIGQMISFQAYNLQSPRNGDAARWTKENVERLPLEQVDLMPEILADAGASEQIAFAADAAFRSLSLNGHATGQPAAPLCANCGAEASILCPHGHAACRDCLLECSNCHAVLCLSCNTRRCHRCRAICCEDCAVQCADCGLWNCLAHLRCCTASQGVAV